MESVETDRVGLRAFAMQVLQHEHDWIRAADTKAGLLLAAGGVFLAFSVGTTSDIVLAGSRDRLLDAAMYLSLVAAVLSGVSIAASFVVILPRLTAPGSGRSLMFFQHIADMADYEDRLIGLAGSPSDNITSEDDHSAMLHEIAQQVVANALVARKKHWWTCVATVFMAAAALATVALVVLCFMHGLLPASR